MPAPIKDFEIQEDAQKEPLNPTSREVGKVYGRSIVRIKYCEELTKEEVNRLFKEMPNLEEIETLSFIIYRHYVND